MKIFQLKFLLCLFMLQNICYAQINKINGTYVFDMTEYLTIREDNFKISLYPVATLLYGLNLRDTILSEGKVEYESDNFIKLTSKDYEWETKKNMTIFESVDSCLKDSIRFNFIFPFDGKYKVILYIGNDYKSRYEFTGIKEIFLPMRTNSILTFSFVIINQTPIELYYLNYLKNVKFESSQNTVKSNKSNSFEISIPDLTNSYFNRFLINGEYIRISESKNVLFWRNEQYWKFGPHY